MKKKLIILAVLLATWCSLAQAAVVYLKNGKIMTGKIVEKNEQYLVLKIGEGESVVRTTIFNEDISRIESEETLSRENSFIPFELFRQQEFQAPLSPPDPRVQYPAIGGSDDQQQYIHKLLEESRWSNSDASAQISQKKNLSIFPAATSGNSSIAGIIRLPELTDKAKGDLYVLLMKENTDQGFFVSPELPYIKMSAGAISSNFVDYDLQDLPEGRYKIMAQWDVALPHVEIGKIENHTVFRRLGTKGDYSGIGETVALGSDDHRFNVNIDCTILIKEKRVIFSEDARQPFEITDIAYKRLGRNMDTFILFVRNPGEIPTRPFNLKVKINGEALNTGTVFIQSLKIDEERAIDLTSCYQEYKQLLLDRDRDQPIPKELKFVVTEERKEEVEFEKTIITF
jgi:hypothetical protein